MRNKLLAMHREWLETLKVEAEQIARAEHAAS